MIDDLQELLSREPFRRFVIVMISGEDFVVNSPKSVAIPMHGETVHVTAPDYTVHIIAVRHILKLTLSTGSRS
jgi:hypothetical protein